VGQGAHQPGREPADAACAAAARADARASGGLLLRRTVKIRRVAFDGFRGLPDREFSLVNPATGRAASLVAVTGPTASGKTSFLDAIVAAKEKISPWGAIQPDPSWLRPGARSAKVTITWELSPAERERTGTDRETITTDSLFGRTLVQSEHDPVVAGLLGDGSLDPTVGKLEYFAANRRMPLGGGVDATRLGEGPVDRELRLTKDNG